MVNSMNERRGATLDITAIKNREDFKKKKNELKKFFDESNLTSDYYEYFDELDPKKCSSKQDYYFKIASEIALSSEMKQKHGAVIVYKKNIIATGYNYACSTYSIHAEVAAISELKGKEKDILPDCELYVVRVGPNKLSNLLKYSKPCITCQNYINKNLIRKTYYSTNYDYDEIMKENLIKKTKKYKAFQTFPNYQLYNIYQSCQPCNSDISSDYSVSSESSSDNGDYNLENVI